MPYLNNKGVRIYYRTEGSGPPVVLMHGGSQDMEIWTEYGYVDALKQSHQVILIDSRGHGHSDKPHDSAAYTLERCTSDIVAVLDALGIKKAHYVGYSRGGWIGFGMAKHAQDRVMSLTLGGTHPYEDSMADWRNTWTGKTTAEVQANAVSKGSVYSDWRRIRFLANDPEALAASPPRESNEAVLADINVPCLVYCGDADPSHALARKAAAVVRGAKFVSLPGLNHGGAQIRSELVLPHLRELFA